jgi:hypothetical protein
MKRLALVAVALVSMFAMAGTSQAHEFWFHRGPVVIARPVVVAPAVVAPAPIVVAPTVVAPAFVHGRYYYGGGVRFGYHGWVRR